MFFFTTKYSLPDPRLDLVRVYSLKSYVKTDNKAVKSDIVKYVCERGAVYLWKVYESSLGLLFAALCFLVAAYMASDKSKRYS